MTRGRLLQLLAVAVVGIVTPGPDTMLTIGQTLRGGRVAGLKTAGGVVTGQLIWSLATGAGLAGLVRSAGGAFEVVRLLGGAYLVALGLFGLWQAARDRPDPAPALPAQQVLREPYLQGLVSNLSNPKMVALFISILPGFLSASDAPVLEGVVVGSVFAAMTFAWLALWSLMVQRLGALLARRRALRVLEAVTGALLVAFGVRTVLQPSGI